MIHVWIDQDAIVVPRDGLRAVECEICKTSVAYRCVVNTVPHEYFCACKSVRAYAEEDMP